MEERAPGGERMLTPKQWFLLAAEPADASYLFYQRVLTLPDRPMTRFEYFEELAFAQAKEP